MKGVNFSARLNSCPVTTTASEAAKFCRRDKAAFEDILDALEGALNVLP
jgi:hypothetical protein